MLYEVITHLEVVDRLCSELPRGEDVFQAEPGVIHPAVPVEGDAVETLPAQGRLPLEGRLGGKDAVRVGVAERGQQVVEEHAGADRREGARVVVVDGDEEGERADQMGSDRLQDAPLATGLEDESYNFV